MDDNLKETILKKQEIYAILGNQLIQVKERQKVSLSLSQNTIVYMDPSKIVSDLSFLKAYDLIECENEIYSLKKPDGVEITKELIKETYGS